MTKLNPRRAGAGWFLFYLDVLNSFVGGGFDRSKVASGTNLCTMVKTLAAGIAILVVYAAVVAGTVWFLLKAFLDQGVALLVGIGIIAGIALAVWFIVWVGRRISEWGERRDQRLGEEQDRQWREERGRRKAADDPPPIQPVPAEPSTFQLFREYMQAVKDRFCPTVTWSEPIPEQPNWLASKLPHVVLVIIFGVLSMLVYVALSALGNIVTSVNANVTQVGTSQCTFAGARTSGGLLTVDLDCSSGIKAWSQSSKVIIRLLNDREAVLECTVYKDMEADCGE